MPAGYFAVRPREGELKLNRQFFWPLAGLLVSALISMNRFYPPHLTLEFGIASWFADMAVVLVLSLWPETASFGAFTAGVFLVVPCFLWESPLVRGSLMCCMAFPLAVATLPL